MEKKEIKNIPIKILLTASNRESKIAKPLKTQNLEVIKPKSKNKIIKLFISLFLMSKYQPDIIIVDQPLYGFIFFLLRKKYILRLRGDHWQESEDRINSANILWKICEIMRFYIGIIAIKNATVIIPVSKYLKDVILGRLRIKKSRIIVIHPPINFEKLTKIKKYKKNDIIISFVSNFSFEKKTEGIIKILPTIDYILSKYKNVRCVIAGKGKYKKRVLKKIENLKNKNKIKLKFYHNISYLLNITDIFLYYSFLDAFPVSVQEAKYFGIPVIVNDECGMKEQVNHGVNGYIVKSNDLGQLKYFLEKLIENENLRLRMGENGKKDIEKNYNYTIIGEKFFRVINKLIEK